MTASVLMNLWWALCLASVFLILGTILRARVGVFQSTFMPAAVIGGFLLLGVGPEGLNLIPIPQDWMTAYRLLPGLLIIPIVTAAPLGMASTSWGTLKGVSPLMGVALGISFLQFALGFSVNALVFPDLYPTFGWELGLGFAGGHGTAGLLAQMLKSQNLSFWTTAQGVGVTLATVGLLGGILGGMALIQVGLRRGWSVLGKEAALPATWKTGLVTDVAEQTALGRETVKGTSVETLALHFAVIAMVCGLAAGFLAIVKAYHVPVLSKITVWAYGLLFMLIFNTLWQKSRWKGLLDGRVKGRLTGMLTDFAVLCAIASMPLKAMTDLWVPIAVLSVLGLLLTGLYLVWAVRKTRSDTWFEETVALYGMYTGVFMTGLLLLRVVDPEGKTPALSRYALTYALSGLVYFAALNAILELLLSKGAGVTALVTLGLGLLATALACALGRMKQ